MDLPWRIFTPACLTASFVLVRYKPEYSIHGSYSQTFWTLLAILGLTGFVWKAILYPKLFSPLRHLPKPPGGSFLNGQFWRITFETTGHPGREWINGVPNDGLICYTSLFNKERVMVTTPQGAAEVLNTKVYDYVKPPFIRNGLIRVLGDGLVLAEGEEHKFQRKHLMPAFQYRHIRDLSPIFWSKARELVNALTTIIDSARSDSGDDKQPGVINIETWYNRFTLDVIGLAGMGQDFGGIQDENAELLQSYKLMFSPTRSRIILFVMSLFIPQFIVRAIPATHNKNISKGSNTIKAAARRLIKQKQANLQRDEKSMDVDIMSVAINSGIFSEEQLVAEAMTFLAAGHETTATVLAWATLELGRYPEMQSRLREEIRAKISSLDGPAAIDPEMIDKCHYLLAFCNEVLRMHSPVAVTARRSIRDTSILGQKIAEGTEVIVPISAFNYSVQQWGDDAGDFKPERWMASGKANNGGAESNYSFMTFLHGPRGCIGSAFAKSEFHHALAAMVGRFAIELAIDGKDFTELLETRTGVTLRPKHGVPVKLKPLAGW